MLQAYLTTFWRQLSKNRVYSFLNILGLSAGLTCFTLIAFWITDELSYDKFNANYNRIFRLVATAKTATGTEESAVSSVPMAKALQDNYPEIENTVRLRMREEIVTHNNQQILQPGILVADASFFDVFSYQLLEGNKSTALAEPYSLILTESTAKKYFGNKDPMGETLLLNMYDTAGQPAVYTVTGIMPDAPQNAHFTFNMIASFKTIEVARPEMLTLDGWGDASIYTYVLLKNNVDHKAVSKKIPFFYEKYVGELAAVWKPIYSYKLQPLRDIYLHSNLEYEIAPMGNINQVYIFSTIAIFILLLAGINYTNLATARSISRAKEAGIKKVVGAGKQQLVAQYLFESIFTALIALWLSFAFSLLLGPFFYHVTNKTLSLFSSPGLMAFLFGVTILLGLLSGIYPATILSAFRPALILKGSFKSGDKGTALRQALLGLQFVITIVLVTGIVIIYSQMSFIKHKDLGYNKDALVFLKVNGNAEVVKGFDAFRNQLSSSAFINGITTSNSMIAGGLGSGGSETIDADGNPLRVSTARLRTDANYLSVYGIKLLAGRNFTATSATDTLRQVIVNETAVKKIGWKSNDAAIGKPFRIGNTSGVVIGVVNDFHFNSLEQSIGPLAIYPLTDGFSRITLKIDMSHANNVLALIENTWKKQFPSALFDFDFVSHQVKEQYRAEERFSNIFLYFSLLSLLIACLGLYGLVSYVVFQRTKEIGIRKILGATPASIMGLLSGNFLRLILVSYVISIPIAWYIMRSWLQDFAYRVELSWWMFLVAGVLVCVVALVTVSVQSVKAAVGNPVRNLRVE